jgi:predicted lipoprotein with Yx(FWY)xxD motif
MAVPARRRDGGSAEAHVTRLTTLVVATAAVAAAALTLVVLLRGSSATKQQRDRVRDGQAVRVARTKVGRILVNGQGRTVYLFLKDRHGTSTCYDGCARVWPPATASGPPRVGPGVAAAQLTTTRRTDHTRQLVYYGHPLYTMSADTRPGETAGQGFLGTWFVVSPAGRMIGSPGASAPGEY